MTTRTVRDVNGVVVYDNGDPSRPEYDQAVPNRATVDTAITAALTQLQALIDTPPVAVIPAGSRTLAQLTADVRALRDGVQANRAGSQQIAAALRRTLRLVRGDFAGTD